jgi:hypothetical protein
MAMGSSKISTGYYAIVSEPGRATVEDKDNTKQVFDRVFSNRPLVVHGPQIDVTKSTVKGPSISIKSGTKGGTF